MLIRRMPLLTYGVNSRRIFSRKFLSSGRRSGQSNSTLLSFIMLLLISKANIGGTIRARNEGAHSRLGWERPRGSTQGPLLVPFSLISRCARWDHLDESRKGQQKVHSCSCISPSVVN
ncbi:hypothetical protein Zmor_010158 [Zophobas morio]|uniref:Uncharacterized protein n=1 Tax=Zophobas morio TaxID=2755281 RepID=A0AA38IMS0_9CUCU|nr:hypothetical protein Zmor_010158 [Zophobas morio]